MVNIRNKILIPPESTRGIIVVFYNTILLEHPEISKALGKKTISYLNYDKIWSNILNNIYNINKIKLQNIKKMR